MSFENNLLAIAQDKLNFNNRKIYNLYKKLKDYEEDKNKKDRRKEQKCKWCTYMDKDIIVMNAFTTYVCKKCAKQGLSANSDVDMYCEECAKTLNVCKHCGSLMD